MEKSQNVGTKSAFIPFKICNIYSVKMGIITYEFTIIYLI